MNNIIVFGILTAGVIGVGKLILKVISEESVPPYVAALNAQSEKLQSPEDLFTSMKFGHNGFDESVSMSFDGSSIGWVHDNKIDSGPSVNIDGSPMCGSVDINGNPYGVISD